VPDIAATFLRWTWMRAVLHRGYWLVTNLYLIVDAHLSPVQLVLNCCRWYTPWRIAWRIT